MASNWGMKEDVMEEQGFGQGPGEWVELTGRVIEGVTGEEEVS